jgi:hypothetical protein
MVRVVKSDMHSSIEDWLMKSGYALELRVAAACRRVSLPTYASYPYQDPTQPGTTREADVVVMFDRRLSSFSEDSVGVLAVIECKFPKGKPWVAILRPDETVDGFTFTASQSASEDSLEDLRIAWGGLAPFGKAPSADSLVSALVAEGKSDYNAAGPALRQAMSAASGVQQQYTPPRDRHLTITLPVLVTAGELVGASLNSTGEIKVEDLSNVFVRTPRPAGGGSVGNVHVMTVDYFTEHFAPDLDSARQSRIVL